MSNRNAWRSAQYYRWKRAVKKGETTEPWAEWIEKIPYVPSPRKIVINTPQPFYPQQPKTQKEIAIQMLQVASTPQETEFAMRLLSEITKPPEIKEKPQEVKKEVIAPIIQQPAVIREEPQNPCAAITRYVPAEERQWFEEMYQPEDFWPLIRIGLTFLGCLSRMEPDGILRIQEESAANGCSVGDYVEAVFTQWWGSEDEGGEEEEPEPPPPDVVAEVQKKVAKGRSEL